MNRMTTGAKVAVIAFFTYAILTVFAISLYRVEKEKIKDKNELADYEEIALEINEIQNTYCIDDKQTYDCLNQLRNKVMNIKDEDYSAFSHSFIVIAIFFAGLVAIVFFVIYVMILRPFSRLEDYAKDIASGNFDVELKYDRVNMFGEFTWAFDHMRTELKRARKNEIEAIENNKTVIATLSHDIKTPIASIKAYSEALEENMDSTVERRNRYISVILKKCDEVTKITNDMFLHSLHDLDRITVREERVDINSLLYDTVEAMGGASGQIQIKHLYGDGILEKADASRIIQIFENIFSNAQKYAKGTPVEIESDGDDSEYRVKIRDYGNGIKDEDLPFVCEKFYRGKNVENSPGAGLGLFIVKYLINKMHGDVLIYNANPGLCVELIFKKNIS